MLKKTTAALLTAAALITALSGCFYEDTQVNQGNISDPAAAAEEASEGAATYTDDTAEATDEVTVTTPAAEETQPEASTDATGATTDGTASATTANPSTAASAHITTTSASAAASNPAAATTTAKPTTTTTTKPTTTTTTKPTTTTTTAKPAATTTTAKPAAITTTAKPAATTTTAKPAATTTAATTGAAVIGNYNQRPQEQWEINYADQVFELVNQIRAEYGLAPYKKLTALTNAAVTRAWEISVIYGHTRPDGSSCSTVIKENGLNFSVTGENIAAGQSTAERVMQDWMASTMGHKEAILSTEYQYMGVGFYCVPDGYGGYKYYWSQEFYTPLN